MAEEEHEGKQEPASPLRIVGLQVANVDATTAEQRDGNVALGIQAIREHAQSATEPVDLYLLGEMFTVGYSEDMLGSLDAVAESLDDGPSLSSFVKLAVELNTIICYGFPRRRTDGGICISQCCVYPHNDMGTYTVRCYDKLHLCHFGDCNEQDYFVPGDAFDPANCVIGPIKGIKVRHDRVGSLEPRALSFFVMGVNESPTRTSATSSLSLRLDLDPPPKHTIVFSPASCCAVC